MLIWHMIELGMFTKCWNTDIFQQHSQTYFQQVNLWMNKISNQDISIFS